MTLLVQISDPHLGAEAGELDAARLAWLERELAAAPGRPTMLGTHHPPLQVGVRAWDILKRGSLLSHVQPLPAPG